MIYYRALYSWHQGSGGRACAKRTHNEVGIPQTSPNERSLGAKLQAPVPGAESLYHLVTDTVGRALQPLPEGEAHLKSQGGQPNSQRGDCTGREKEQIPRRGAPPSLCHITVERWGAKRCQIRGKQLA